MSKLPPNATLVLIDVQKAFEDPVWGPRNNPEAELKMARVLQEFRKTGRPVIHVQHDSVMPNSTLRPELPGNAIKDEVAPIEGEPVLHKTVNSAFIGTDLEQRLKDAGVRAVVFCGLTTNHCVSTTVRMAGNLGFEAYVLSDGTATFDIRGPDGRVLPAELLHAVGLAELHGEFATVLSSDELIAKLRSDDQPSLR
jgi:nicotinamidase-related amidase